MKRRYLKTVESVLALKDTDTKIYQSYANSYYKFVDGILCRFFDNDDKEVWFNSYIPIGRNSEYYILEEEPMQEATEEDVGNLCKFYDDKSGRYVFRILDEITEEPEYPFRDEDMNEWKHCRRLTPSEVAELTGYKVEGKE